MDNVGTDMNREEKKCVFILEADFLSTSAHLYQAGQQQLSRETLIVSGSLESQCLRAQAGR